MPFFRFTSDFVYWAQLKKEDHENIKNTLLPQVREKDKNVEYFGKFDYGDAVTSYFDPNGNDFLMKEDLFNKIVWEPLDNMLKEHNKNNEYNNILISNSIISSGWYTSYKENSVFHQHHHYTIKPIIINGKTYYSSFSLIYILNDENEHNCTKFTSYDTLFTVNGDVTYNTKFNKEIGEGTVLIFPSRLLHMVDLPEIKGRVTIAYNIFSEY